LSLYGQFHHYEYSDYNGIPTIVTASVDKREYSFVKIIDNKVFIARINF
jgi:hypothetical protein